MRPAELARDETPTMPVLQHAVRKLEEAGEQYDAICILQPTHPFRSADDIDRCVELLANSEADAVMTIAAVPIRKLGPWRARRPRISCQHRHDG